jgi:predicted O-linked N-acetylglucosamine transferase (SPINDLY family)
MLQAVDGGEYLQALQLLQSGAKRSGGMPPEALRLQIRALQGLGRHAEAVHSLDIRALHQVTEIAPKSAQAWAELGRLLEGGDHLQAALAAYEKATILDSQDSDSLRRLGNLLHKAGRLEESRQALECAVSVDSRNPDTLFSLGMYHQLCGDRQEAAACFRRSLSFNPSHRLALVNLAGCLQRLSEFEEAVAACDTALTRFPDDEGALLCRAWSHFGLFEVEDALDDFRAAIQANPGFWLAYNGLLQATHYREGLEGERESVRRRFGEELVASAGLTASPSPGLKDSNRRLRIGYLSPDLRQHSVAFFMLPILACHNRAAVEVFCYANVERPDDTTAECMTLADHWRNLLPLSDEGAAALILEDEIDILVDLAGHTAGNRLGVLARKPAPLQLTYLGYPDRTGVATIDYRITDAHADPLCEGEERGPAEQFVRLEGGFHCYRPPSEAPVPQPYEEGRGITFGSFNNADKLSPRTIDLWSSILLRVPGSSLLLKASGLGSEAVRGRLWACFAERGVEASRVELVGRIPSVEEHLRLYERVDIALDPFPYHGTTTTFEALWMGVPVVTLAGKTHASRVGVSILHTLNLTELLAQDDEAYIRIAVALAVDHSRLRSYHVSLRNQLQESPFMDEPGFAEKLEACYRRLWIQKSHP